MALTEKQAGAGTCPKVTGKDGDSCAASFIDIYGHNVQVEVDALLADPA